MRKLTLIAIALLALTATFTGNAQTRQPVKTDEQIAADTPIHVFIPDDAVAAKLTADEQAALKVHLTKLMASSMGLGYQFGAKASSDFLLKEFARQIAEQQRLAAQQSQPTRLDKVIAVLDGISQGAAVASQKRLDCVSRRIGGATYTTCY